MSHDPGDLLFDPHQDPGGHATGAVAPRLPHDFPGLDLLPSHVAILDESGVILATNRAWINFALENGGAAERCGVGTNYLDVTDQAVGEDVDSARSVAKGIREILSGKREAFDRAYACHAPGEERWFVLRARRLVGDGPVRVIVFHEKFSSDQRAGETAQHLVREQAARAEAEAARLRLTTGLDRVTDGFCLIDRDWRLTFVNGEAQQYLAMPGEALIGRPIWNLFPGLSDNVRKRLLHLAGGASPVDLELKSTLFERWLHFRFFPAEDGVSVYFRDVTDRKLAELKLRASEERERFLARAAGELVRSLDVESGMLSIGRLLVPEAADACAVAIAGDAGAVARVEVVTCENGPRARPLRNLLMPGVEPATGMLRLAERVLSAGGEAVFLPRGAGEPALEPADRQVLQRLGVRSLLMVPLRTDRRTMGAILLVRTERADPFGLDDLQLVSELAGRAALALENSRLYQEARRAILARDEMIGIVSHDLRSPLNLVKMACALLDDAPLEGVHRRHLAMIERATEHMSRLTRDLLDVSRLDAGELVIDPEPRSPESLLRDAIEMNAHAALERQVRFDTRLSPDLPAVLVDPCRIQQLFGNLIENAIRYAPSGSPITLTAAPDPAGVRFGVGDEGPGISAADLPHVFDPFWQADRKNRSGAGLGLAIARGIVEAHRGEISIESEPGRGTTVSFVLPSIPTP